MFPLQRTKGTGNTYVWEFKCQKPIHMGFLLCVCTHEREVILPEWRSQTHPIQKWLSCELIHTPWQEITNRKIHERKRITTFPWNQKWSSLAKWTSLSTDRGHNHLPNVYTHRNIAIMNWELSSNDACSN